MSSQLRWSCIDRRALHVFEDPDDSRLSGLSFPQFSLVHAALHSDSTIRQSDKDCSIAFSLFKSVFFLSFLISSVLLHPNLLFPLVLHSSFVSFLHHSFHSPFNIFQFLRFSLLFLCSLFIQFFLPPSFLIYYMIIHRHIHDTPRTVAEVYLN